ncbi:MAG: zinc ribbon domain-containing protein [Dehalococcoidia bacterium]|jgi:hypothetical protein
MAGDSAIRLAVALAASYWAILWLGAVIWTYRDIRDRGTDTVSQAVAVLLVLVFNLPGLVLYLILRPRETLAEAYVRNLETEAVLHEMGERGVCPSCQRQAQADFFFCPHCRTRLREACAGCGHPISLSWVVCPYCGRDRLQAMQPAAATASPVPPVAAAPPAPPPPPPQTAAPILSVAPPALSAEPAPTSPNPAEAGSPTEAAPLV